MTTTEISIEITDTILSEIGLLYEGQRVQKNRRVLWYYPSGLIKGRFMRAVSSRFTEKVSSSREYLHEVL